MESSVLHFGFSLALATLSVNSVGSETDGYLLAIKVLQIDQPKKPYYYNHALLFKIEFDGSVTQFWNYSYNNPHLLFNENLFAMDTDSSLIYLGVVDQFLALDMTTGKVKVNISLQAPNLQYFWSYNYIATEEALVGVCTGNSMWNWCRIKCPKQLVGGVKLEFLYQLPGTEEFSPTDGVYYMDQKHQSIWYFSGIAYAYGLNYTTGKQIFYGNSIHNSDNTKQDDCIVHDHALNRTFTIVSQLAVAVAVGELHPWPRNATILLELPPDLRTDSIGSCDYDPKSHTLIGLMTSASSYLENAMPNQILLVDVVSLKIERRALPMFAKHQSNWPVTGVKFIPTI